MASSSYKFVFLLFVAVLFLLPAPAAAFGAGNIASISKVEGKNWRHGDIEDMLKTVAFLKGHKWTSMMIKRVYFGNWLRDYSQAVDVGTLKGVPADTIRVLLWILAFMSFGYATGEFEVTTERLGCYRPEEHIDNPKDYADNADARQYDPRLRPPVEDIELAVDMNTGMKNYIANESGGWATSAGYVKFSFTRAIHFGRLYTNGAHGTSGKEEDLCEALRCLGQALHTLEDFGAHTNYCELALRELGYHNVFSHCGASSEITVRGKRIYPLVTGTFGGVDFLHSVLGEATDHITQSEVDEVNTTLIDAASGKRGGPNSLDGLCDIMGKVPGTGDLISEARRLQADSDAQAAMNAGSGSRGVGDAGYGDNSYGGDGYATRADQPGQPGGGLLASGPDPAAVIQKIYPILLFRDKVVRAISAIVSKIPGLENLIETITERVTLFVLSLLAPFVIPVIKAASKGLKQGSSGVIDASGKHQFEVWTNPHSTDPTHSMLSKDHFSNILNEPAGQVATTILQYVAPRVIYAWDHPDIPVDQVLNDVCRVFHHPALRDQNLEIHRNMFAVMEKWVRNRPGGGSNLNQLLSSESVKAGHNHIGGDGGHGGHGPAGGHGGASHGAPASGSGFGIDNLPGFFGGGGSGGSGGGGMASFLPGLGSHSKVSGSPFEMFNRSRELGEFDNSTPGGTSYGGGAAAGGSGGLAEPHYGGQQPFQHQQVQTNDPYAYEIPTGYQSGYQDSHSTQGPHYGQAAGFYGQEGQQGGQQQGQQGNQGGSGAYGGQQGPYGTY